MSYTKIDAARQVKRGTGFELPLDAGGTGRMDGIGRGVLVKVANPQPDAQPGEPLNGYVAAAIPIGAPVKALGWTVYGAMAVRATTGLADDPIGVAVTAIAVSGAGYIMVSGYADVSVTGTVVAGDELYASATSGLASTAGTGSRLGIAATDAVSGVVTALIAPGDGSGTVTQYASILAVIDGGGAAITTGIKGDVRVPFACEIERASLLADQTGSIVVDVWVDTYANYPPTVADTITAAAKPTLSAVNKSSDITLTGWTKTLAEGSTIRVNVDSVATVQRVSLELKVRKT